MFHALKPTDVSEQMYSLEPVTPPFIRKKETTTTKTACISCRNSKLKCSGGLSPCERCTNKNIECIYPSPPRSRSNAPPNKSSPRNRSRWPEMPTPGFTDIPVDTDVHVPDIASTISDIDITVDSAASSSLADSGIQMPATTSILEEYDFNRSWEEQYRSPRTWTTLTNEDINLLPQIQSPSCAIDTRASCPGQTSCSCLSRAVNAHSGMEMLVWSYQRDQGEVDAVLERQKITIQECSSLLDCAKCTAQPSYVMLLLSICSKILDTIEEEGQVLKQATTDLYDSSASQTGIDEGLNARRAKRKHISKLDMEDEFLIVQSLLKARVGKLESLLKNIKALIAHKWPTHSRYLQQLQRRINRESSP